MTGLVHLAALIACAAPAEPTPEQLVRDLGSPLFAVREKATRELWKLGEKARPALTEALQSPDAEVARRAKDVLDKFDWGVFPDTPAEVHQQIREFRSGIPGKQLAAVSALLKLGEPAVPALRTLLAKDLPPENRAAVFDHLTWSLRQEVPGLLFAGKPDRAEALLALNTLGPSDAGLNDYAVFLHLRGRAKPAAGELERVKAAGGPPGEAAAKALVFVYRVAGDTDKAKAAARALDEAGKLPVVERFGGSPPNLYESLLEDLGAWGELADRPVPRANSADGLKIFRLRMAGRPKEADELADRQKDADPDQSGDGPDEATLALMLNHRPLEGIDRLKATRNAPHILADVLAARLQFREALDLVDGKRAGEAPGTDETFIRRLYYATRKGRMLAQLGQRDAAAQVFGQVVKQMAGPGHPAVAQLIRAEVRSGQFDLACEHLGWFLNGPARETSSGLRGAGQDGFEVLFEADADAASYWWNVLRQAKPAGESPGTTMRRVRALLTGSASEPDLAHAVKAAAGTAPSVDATDGQAADWWANRALALAAAYRAAGKPDDAIAALAEVADRLAKAADNEEARSNRRSAAGSRGWVFGIDERFRFWVELGDLLSEQGRHKDAAVRLEQGWRKYPENPVLLYLSGRALQKVGDEKEGRRRTELAHWVALGNARLRGRFLEELNNRGATADAKRERDLAREAGWVAESYIGNVWNQVARASVLVKDFDGAAAANRRAVHYLLRNNGVSYVEGFAYLTVPQGVRGYAARSLLAAGKVDEAVALAKESLTVMPGHSELVIGMVPELDRLGRKKEADELFQRVWDAYGAVIEQHPNSGWARYSAAWIAAGCRRELDAALAHAKKAVELDPELRFHKEALAEVHFRRGERDQALKLMRELTAADRRNHHYKRQLDRYQTGDVSSPLPDADDD